MKKSKLTVIARIKSKKGKEKETRKVLTGLLAPTRKEKGCFNYDLHESNKAPGLFYFYENWTGQEALDAHLRSPHIKKMIRRSKALFQGPVKIELLTELKAAS